MVLSPENGIGLDILVLVPLLHVLPRAAFPRHAQLLHDPARCRIPRQMVRLHPIQPERFEAVLHHPCAAGAVQRAPAPPRRPPRAPAPPPSPAAPPGRPAPGGGGGGGAGARGSR